MFSLQLWRTGPFVRFFIGASLSAIGDWFNTVAIVVLTYRLSGDVSSVAVTILASVVPRVLLAPVGGILADRLPRRLVEAGEAQGDAGDAYSHPVFSGRN